MSGNPNLMTDNVRYISYSLSKLLTYKAQIICST